MTFNPTPKVNSQYGAPMGRRDNGAPAHVDGERLYLRHVPLDSGGYDSGGAYWGIGQRLYAWSNAEGDRSGYFRARDRDAAKVYIREDAPDARFFR